MKTRTNQPVELVDVKDIKELTGEQIDELECGDIVTKQDSTGKHSYVVTYKKDRVGICLTYSDASVVETVSYDYTGGEWVYNSTDITELSPLGYIKTDVDSIVIEPGSELSINTNLFYLTNKNEENIMFYDNGDDYITLGKDLVGEENVSISADEIVERMSGYSFTKNTGLNWTPIYVGVVKNGNKLTFVAFGTYTYATGDSANLVCGLGIPDSIGTKLQPFSYGGENNYLQKGELPLFNTANAYEKPKVASFDVQKSSNTTLYLNFRNLNDSSLENGKTYLFRVEVTFLLSENLAV